MTGSRAWEPQRRARRRALQALYQWQITGQEYRDIVVQFFETQDFSSVDEGLFEGLVKGVVTDSEILIEALQPLLDRPFGDCDTMERILLLMGAWQLKNSPDLPFKVVLEESIDLAHRFGSDQSHLFVNAVLDKAAHSWGNARDMSSTGQ